MVWDTAGQEEFDALTRAYYRGAHGAILAFSSTDLQSFEAVDSWRSKVSSTVVFHRYFLLKLLFCFERLPDCGIESRSDHEA